MNGGTKSAHEIFMAWGKFVNKVVNLKFVNKKKSATTIIGESVFGDEHKLNQYSEHTFEFIEIKMGDIENKSCIIVVSFRFVNNE